MCPHQVRVEVHGVGAATECIRGDVWNQTLSVLMVGKVTTATVTVLDQFGLVQVSIRQHTSAYVSIRQHTSAQILGSSRLPYMCPLYMRPHTRVA